MWILMLDTYVGGIGTFPKGHKLDLAPDILKHIPKGSYKKTCAPWDEHKDKGAAKLTLAKTKASEAQVWIDVIQDKADEAKQKAEQLTREAAAKQTESEKAKAEADKANAVFQKAAIKAKSTASEKTKEKVEKLKTKASFFIDMAERKDLEFRKAGGLLMVAIAEQGLTRLDVDKAKRQARAAAKELKALQSEMAEAKAKPETDNAKPEENSEPTDTEGTGNKQAEDAGNSEG